MKKILVISHDASLTGAPILLLNLLKILKANEEVEIHMLVRVKQGKLLDDFQKFGKVFFWRDGTEGRGLGGKLKRKVKTYLRKLRLKNLISTCDFVFSNTATNGDVLEFIKKCKPSIRIFSYVHELKLGFQQFVSPSELQKLKLFTDTFIAPSEAVKTFLEKQITSYENHGAIKKMNYYVPVTNSSLNGGMKKKFKNKFVVGSCGTTDWRKGPDLFIAVVKYLRSFKESDDILFYWKGGYASLLDTQRFIFQIEQAGLQNRIIHEEASGEMNDFFNQIDLFFLTSKEDPYPLVVLEAAGFKKPTLCFEGSGGAVEFVGTDAGSVVPYFDIKSAGEEILNYKKNYELLKAKGAKAAEKLGVLHQDQQLIIKQFKDICYES